MRDEANVTVPIRPVYDRAELGSKEWAWTAQGRCWRTWDHDSNVCEWVRSGPPPAEARLWQSPASLREFNLSVW